MQRLRRALKLLFYSASIITLLLIAAALTVLRWPDLVINERTLPWIAATLERGTGISVKWDEGSLDVESLAWLEKRFTLSFRGICAKRQIPRLDACFDDFFVHAILDFSRLRVRVTQAGPVSILGGRIEATIPESTPSEPEEPESPERRAKRWERWAKTPLKRVKIELDSIDLTEGRDRYRGTVKLDAATARDGLPGGKLSVTALLPDELRIRAQAEGQLMLPVRVQNRIQAQISWPGQERPLEVRDCALDFLKAKTEVDCWLKYPLPLPPKNLPRLHIPTSIAGRIRATLNPMPFPPDFDQPWSGRMEITLDPILNPLLQGRGTIRTELAGVVSQFPTDWKLDSELDLRLGIRSFEHLEKRLRKTEWAIPAPFHVLKGEVSLGVRGKSDLFGGTFPLEFTTRLNSEKQSFDSDSSGVFFLRALVREAPPSSRAQQAGEAPSPAASLKLRTRLTDVRLELPDIGLEAPPQLLPDARFASQSEEDEDGAAFAYDIRVETPPEKPVQLLSNIAKNPIPVALRLRLSDEEAISGEIKVSRFPLKLFRRDAQFEHFRLQMSDPLEESPVDGRVRVRYADYTMSILVLGTAGKPRIRLLSDPPLPEEQLVAVLLFGKPLEELDPDQSASVDNTRFALADGALGLASLYVLASTPIQSLGYNPNTGQFTLKLRLAAGTSLNLGSTSGGEVSEIGLRKRLGPHWTISTDLSRSVETRQRTGSAYLEWHNRY